MKILIAYTSKNGTTAECVRRLSGFLRGTDTTVADLRKASPDPSAYDLILVGGSVRFGKLSKELKRFLTEKRAVLLQKRLGLFLCCGLAHEQEYYMEKLFPKDLRDAAFSMMYFGGSLRCPSASLFDRALLHSMRSNLLESEIEDGEYTPSLPGILPENIERMASFARREFSSGKTAE